MENQINIQKTEEYLTEEYFVIKIDKNSYWTEHDNGFINTTTDIKKAEKYTNYNKAKTKAQQIAEINNLVTCVIKYTITIQTEYIDMIIPPNCSSYPTFWDYIKTINQDKEYDKWRLAMDIAREYHVKGKNPDDYIKEIIDEVNSKTNKK